jgi:phage tail protein X
MNVYTTTQFAEIDAICHRWYGGTAGTVEAVIRMNPGLADMMPILPPGVSIFMPDLPKPTETVSLIRFWEAAQ